MRLLLLFILLTSIAKADKLDSLLSALPQLKDTSRAVALKEIGMLLNKKGKFPEARKYLTEAYQLSVRLGFHRQQPRIISEIGISYFAQGNLTTAKDDFQISLASDLKTGNPKDIGTSYNNLGTVYHFNGDHVKGIDLYLKALKCYEKIHDTLGIYKVSDNLGILYREQKLFDRSEEFHLKAKRLNELALNKPVLFGKNYNNLGNLYKTKGDYKKSLECYRKSHHYKKITEDQNGEALCLAGIAEVQLLLNHPDSAEFYYKLSHQLFSETEDTDGIVSVYNNLASLYIDQGRFSEAYRISRIAADSAIILKAQDLLSDAYINLGEASFNLNQYREAYDFLSKGKQLNDSIFNADNSKKINDIITRYQVEKKEAELNAKAVEEKKRNDLIIYSVTGILLLTSVFSIFIFNRFKVTRKQKGVIEHQKKEITDSINYARKIQNALLPPAESFASSFTHQFILYYPKDIVSGDFYWKTERDNVVYFAVGDCTGHGVPGAFVSSICIEKLNDAVKTIDHPGKILSFVNAQLLKTFQSSSNDGTKDGMDIALCAYDRNRNILSYAGANRSILIHSNGTEQEIKGTKASIAGFTSPEQTFEEHAIELKEGDQVYLFTDGFPDQFGGSKKKKIGTKTVKSWIRESSSLAVHDQKVELEKRFKDWKGELEQIDDVTMMSIRF